MNRACNATEPCCGFTNGSPAADLFGPCTHAPGHPGEHAWQMNGHKNANSRAPRACQKAPWHAGRHSWEPDPAQEARNP